VELASSNRLDPALAGLLLPMKLFPLLFFAPFIMAIVGLTIRHMIDDHAD
jgi:hypothetical protein